jgi:hypothetical protein
LSIEPETKTPKSTGLPMKLANLNTPTTLTTVTLVKHTSTTPPTTTPTTTPTTPPTTPPTPPTTTVAFRKGLER